MKKFLTGLATAVALGATMAFAQPNQDHTCQGGHNCNEGGGGSASAEQAQGQLQGQQQGQQQETNVSAGSNSTASGVGVSSSDSNSSSNASGGSSVVSVGGSTGRATSSSNSSAEGGAGGSATASSGDSHAAGGDSSSNSAVGDTTTGDVGVNISDNSSQTLTYEQAASSAARVFAQVCQTGGSAQGTELGVSIVNSDVLCDHLKVAAVMREAYVWEMQHGTYNLDNCISVGWTDRAGIEHIESEVCETPERAKVYLEAYHEALDDALRLMNQTEEVGLIDKAAGFLVRPLLLIGALVLLI